MPLLPIDDLLCQCSSLLQSIIYFWQECLYNRHAGLMFEVHVSFHSVYFVKYQFAVGTGITDKRMEATTTCWNREHFQKSNKSCLVMSWERGNLVQCMSHTKSPFDCFDKYPLCNLSTGYQYKSQHRIPIQISAQDTNTNSQDLTLTKICLLHPLVDSCNLQIWLTNLAFVLPTFKWGQDFANSCNPALKFDFVMV